MDNTGGIALIPARAGSKGLPGKNLRKLAGVPLWRRAIEQGLRCMPGAVLSTDIPEIEAYHMPSDTRFVRRPEELARDDTPMAAVVAHAIDTLELETETIVLLQPTTPLRCDADVKAAIALHATGRFDLVMSVTEADRSILKHGTVSGDQFVPVSDPAFCFTNRQALPAVYKPNGAVYVFSARAFKAAGGFPAEGIGAATMPPERSLDIDGAHDFERAERLLATGEIRSIDPTETQIL